MVGDRLQREEMLVSDTVKEKDIANLQPLE